MVVRFWCILHNNTSLSKECRTFLIPCEFVNFLKLVVGMHTNYVSANYVSVVFKSIANTSRIRWAHIVGLRTQSITVHKKMEISHKFLFSLFCFVILSFFSSSNHWISTSFDEATGSSWLFICL